MKQYGKILDDYTRQIWMLTDIKDKLAVFDMMLEEFDFKGSNDSIKITLLSMSAIELDEYAANITLMGSGMRRV